ncbi:hypothetical protein D3C76_1856210 [compost metagenome]
MVAGLGPVADPGIHPSGLEVRRELRVEQQVVDTQPGIARPVVAKIVPEGVDPLIRVQMTQRIGPALA